MGKSGKPGRFAWWKAISGTGVLVGVVDSAKGWVDAPVNPGRSLYRKLSFLFSPEDEGRSLERLRRWTTARLEYFLVQQRHRQNALLDRFPGADTNRFHPQFPWIQSVQSLILRIERVLGERADAQGRSAASEAKPGEPAARQPPGPPAAPAKKPTAENAVREMAADGVESPPPTAFTKQAAESQADRGRRRRPVEDLLRRVLGWTPYRWEKEAGVTSKVGYRYLSGKTTRLSDDSRTKLEGAIKNELKLKAPDFPFAGLQE